jgi:leucine-rich repeat protein SHOC2
VYSLQFLILTGNKLTSVPVELTQLKFLELLYLNRNQLTDLPKALQGGLQKLMFLELSENKLESVPFCIHSLPKLKELKLDDHVQQEPDDA